MGLPEIVIGVMLVLIAAPIVVGIYKVVAYEIGAAIRRKYLCVPRDTAGLGEFLLTPEELADLYTGPQLETLLALAKTYCTEYCYHPGVDLFTRARALRAFRDSCESEELL